MNNIENILVSILIPCYNHEKYIEDCLKSILCQTYKSIELIICDDCSKDNSYKIIKKFEDELKKNVKSVTIIKNETNMGLVKNLNRMLEIAKGEYIKIIASDDFMKEDAIEKYIEEFEKDANTGVVIANGTIVEESTSFDCIVECEKYYKDNLAIDKDFFEKIFNRNLIFAPGAMIKKSLFDMYGNYDANTQIEDWEFWLRLLSKGIKFSYIDNELIYYRKNIGSMSNISEKNSDREKKFRRLYDNEIYIQEKYKDYVEQSVYVKRKRECLHDYYIYACHLKLYDISKEIKSEFKQWNVKMSFRDKIDVFYHKIRRKG